MIGKGPIERDIVLVGGGHAHVEVLRHFAMRPQAGTRVSLITRDASTPYSGMLPGYLAGHYSFDESHIDLGPLCRKAGARLFHSEARGIELEEQLVVCGDRPPVAFDFLSIDIGSAPNSAPIEGARELAIPIKPVDGFLAHWAGVEDRIQQTQGEFRIVIVGGGAGGVELSLSLRNRLDRQLRDLGRGSESVVLSVVTDSDRLLPQHASAVRQRLERNLDSRRICFHVGHRVVSIDSQHVDCEPSLRLPYDAVILVTDAAAPAWLRETDLSLDDDGFIRVQHTLQSVSHANVFAAGDVASLEATPLLKNGVYAVRGGPVLARNLRAAAAGHAAEAFRPQRRTLALISTGDKNAIASYGGLALEGAWVWKVKDYIDRRWMRRYQELPAMTADEDLMRCGGCGAKVPSEVLNAVLAELRTEDPPEVLVGLNAPDDAAVTVPPPGRVAVQSVDQFRSFIDDPYLFGRITAIHCLSDIHSMGAQAQTAMAIVTLPYAAPSKMEADLRELLRGALRALHESGTSLVGGHTGEGSELGFGLSITGFAEQSRLLHKGGLQEGDVLILTKPIGTGVVLAADMRGSSKSAWLAGAIESMLRPNGSAAQTLLEHRASACTDVTGFGLLGHLGEMLGASRCHAELYGQRIPTLPGAQALFDQGIKSTLQPANEAHAAVVANPGALVNRHGLLFDPQTSGGLLAGVPAGRAQACLDELRAKDYPHAAIIGEVTQGPSGKATLS